MKKLLAFLMKTVAAVGFAGVLAGGTVFLHNRAADSSVEPEAAIRILPVSAAPVYPTDGFTVTDKFIGRLEPAQQSSLAFELGGLVRTIAVDEGDRVAEGQVVATLDTDLLIAELDRLEGQRRQIEANLELAKLTTARQQALQQKGHASTQRFDEARLNVTALEGELDALMASIKRVRINLDKSVIKAPFSGVVGSRSVDLGAVVDAGTPVLDLLETDRPRARIGVAPEVARGLTQGQSLTLQAGGLPIAGTVAAIRPDLTTATRTTTILVALQDERIGDRFSFGDTVAFHVERRVARPGFRLPLSALVEGERGLWSVLTVEHDDPRGPTVGLEVVEVLHASGNSVYVTGTLRSGSLVVDEGRERIIPGQRVSLSGGQEG